ncbi:MAG: TraR/DksA C4-type zinc finger protein [Verrucomicrobia bacterium]|nr:TraR/DksA C4-type zinc finger protein [Verrucomicrobiota bacterium]
MPTKSKKSPKPAPKKAVKKAPVKSSKKASSPAAKTKKPAAKPVKKAAKPAPVAKTAKKAAAPIAKSHKKAKPAPVVKKQPAPEKPAAKKPPLQAVGFLAKQRDRLLTLKDTLLDSMTGVAKDSLRSRAEGSEASAFGMHQADAGSDAYDRDFALSLLSQEQDSLYEIDEALKRIDTGSYGVCEMSGKPILHARLEALPFTRYTVECQAEIEKKNRYSRVRQPVASLFGLGDDEGGDDDDDSSTDSKE